VALVHVQAQGADEATTAHESSECLRKTYVASLQDGCHPTTEEYSKRIDPADDELDR